MNTLARALLLVGALVLALLVGVLIGRGQRAQSTAGNAQAVQITTAPPPELTPPPAPPAPPKTASIPKIAPDLQVQEDAAAVGMTTREGAEAPPARSSAGQPGDAGNAQPAG